MVIHQEAKVSIEIERYQRTETILIPKDVGEKALFTITEADAFSIRVFGMRYFVDVDDYESNRCIRIDHSTRKRKITYGSKNWDKTYVPGTYQLKLRNVYNEEVIQYFFIVQPVGVSLSYRSNMIQAIDEYLKDVHAHKKHRRVQEVQFERKTPTLDNEALRYKIQYLRSHLQTKLVNTFQNETSPKKQNAKSIQKQIQRPLDTTHKKHLNVKKRMTLDIPINQALKVVVKQLMSKDASLHQDLAPLLQELSAVREEVRFLPLMATLPYYRDLYQHFLSKPNTELNIVTQSMFLPVSRKTPDLFELYVLIQLLQSYIAQGYDYTSSQDEIQQQLINQEYGKIRLQKDNMQVHIDYDVELANRTMGMISINSTHQRPDFVIRHYLENQVVKIYVVEVKCRSKRNIFIHENALQYELLAQCKDYLNLGYVDEQENLHKGIIEKVIVVYPSHKSEFSSAFYGQIETRGFGPGGGVSIH